MTISTIDGLGYEELGQPGSQVSSTWLTGSVVTPLVKTTNIVASTALSGASVLATNVVASTDLSGASVRVTNAVASTALSGTSVNATTVTAVNVSGTTAVRSALVNATNVIGTTAVSGVTLNVTTANASNAVLTGSADIPTVYDNTGSPYAAGNVYTTFAAETVISGGMWVSVSGASGGASIKAKAASGDTSPIGVAVATVASGANVSVLTRGIHYFPTEGNINQGVTFGMGGGGALNTINVDVSGTAGGLNNSRGVVLAGASSGAQTLVYLW